VILAPFIKRDINPPRLPRLVASINRLSPLRPSLLLAARSAQIKLVCNRVRRQTTVALYRSCATINTTQGSTTT